MHELNKILIEIMLPNYKRLSIVIAVMALGIAISSYYSISLTEYIGNSGFFDKPERDVPITFLGIFIFFIAMIYLQSGEKEKIAAHDIYELKRLEKKIDTTIEEIKTIQSKNTFTNDEKDELKANIVSTTQNETIKAIFDDNVSKLSEILGLETIKNSFQFSIKRINEEIRKLNLRANVNLVIGGMITLGGLYFLGITAEMMAEPSFLIHEVDGKNVHKETSEIFLTYGPRVLLVIFIEIFAYFFLRLYKLGLDEIKYFQNELTNVESKLISVEVAYITKNHEAMKEALKVLVETERNFILKKGETTVELERAKSESENMQNILKAVPEIFKNKGK